MTMDLLTADRYGRIVARPDRPEAAPRRHARRVGAVEPIVGDKFGAWAGRDLSYINLPGGAMLQFDLSRLNLTDFRSMRDHYQINASLTVLSFILHQIDWHIECADPEIRDMIEQNLRDIWTVLMRGLSQSFWAGFSPMVLNFENDQLNGFLVVDKVKDLVPEECFVNWKKVDGYAPPGMVPPKILQYDGIMQRAMGRTHDGRSVSNSGSGTVIPPENSLWFPLLMENGDYYGRKLLRPAFPAWYFSQIIHLFANRYYERFGEPTPIGRANFDDEIEVSAGQYISGKQAMETIVQGLRSRSSVVLPSDRDPVTKEYDWDIKYLESQMRGADFERYLDRLDEEMSLAVFTPMLLFRTSNVGSYNLGQAHLKIFLWMLNSIAGDLKYYIQKYIVDRLHDINFGAAAPKASWVYRKLGKDDSQVLAQVLQALIAQGTVRPDLEELGVAIGLTIREVEQMAPGTTGQPVDDTTDKDAPDVLPDRDQDSPPSITASSPASLDRARSVIGKGVTRAFNTVSNGKQVDSFGYRNSLVASLVESGADTATASRIADRFYAKLDRSLPDLSVLAGQPETYRNVLANLADEALRVAV
jgi:hypothetical protein